MKSVRVAIIGAGFAGVGLAASLLRKGVRDVTVFERSGEVGGVWRDNTYPGAACDVPSYLYSYSFAPKRDWSRRYAPQQEIQDYIVETADKLGVTPLVRFNTEIVSAVWHEVDQEWQLTDRAGNRTAFEVVVFSCGQMSQPLIPELVGADEFSGPTMHSARWNPEIDLAGKRVAVVGTGASAIQFVPEIAKIAERVTVYQRSPVHVMPKPDPVYEKPMSRWQFWSRRYALFLQKEALSARVNHFPGLMKRKESQFAEHLVAQVPDETLRAKVMPHDRFGCKRILVSDHWYPALLRDNVEVVPSRVARVGAHEVVAADGESREADVIIYGTGFQSTRFMLPLDIVGVDGISLEERWNVGAAAYLGTQVAGFPNLFLTYGPNSNVGHNSILFMIESQIHYIVSAVRRIAKGKARSVVVSDGVFARFNERIQHRSQHTVYATGCTNWFINENGVHTQNWPGSVIPYWWRTRWIRPRHMVESS
ncbi:flavin-containing monooxygenase [Amnibacterium flavum]|uniref:4-hydroxyacetophenone monooxygenase n=1 Tax=Amnibacterium flavum TaxID=2173173 RepID=A0A2V1HVU9_9MICO|nr:NAD(P)/FAD-dependent oxidoreductase [Amnibacterium flavum]PVZ94517.1 4-hydroxyacetophenone monooxygenase [Amnibacterium flavum]